MLTRQKLFTEWLILMGEMQHFLFLGDTVFFLRIILLGGAVFLLLSFLLLLFLLLLLHPPGQVAKWEGLLVNKSPFYCLLFLKTSFGALHREQRIFV